MKIAVIGSGAREHAIVWKLAKHHSAESIFCLPGNGGIPNSKKIDLSDYETIKTFCKEENITTVIVGPEQPLAGGLVDELEALNMNISIFGPKKQAAKLEASKVWAKKFMLRNNVATAPFWIFECISDTEMIIEELNGDLVIKYDGLAAGKGVVVCSSIAEAKDALDTLRERYGEQSSIIIEKKLKGFEVSIVAITDGKTVRLLPASKDHKRAFDGDQGPNTGGMGAICPVEVGLKSIKQAIIEPTLKGLEKEGIPFCGFLYFGVMMTENGPMLLEYNVRLGDPEAQVILPMLKTDLLELIHGACEGKLDEISVEINEGVCVNVVLVSEGYPGKYSVGYNIYGLEDLKPDTLIFHAGTRRFKERLLSYGGRVLNVVRQGSDLDDVVSQVYVECEKLSFNGVVYRQDIGRQAALV